MYRLTNKKLFKPFNNQINSDKYFFFLKKILNPDKELFILAIIYGIAISILGLATPICVQLLINSAIFTAMLQPIFILGIILLILVSLYGLASILQFHITEIFQRRFFARMSYEIGMTLLNANHQNFEESNQTELVNRFFETIAIQKTIPKLLSKTFTIILQSLVGLILIAFYHPFFLIFSIGIPLTVYSIWKNFSTQAIIYQFNESRRKYDLVGWFEDIARNHLLFKSQIGRDYGKYKINFLTGLYLDDRKIHYRNLIIQVILLFVLYATATTLLLILGGWLILKDRLSIGQLVACELIISATLYNIANLGRDFENFYDLISSSEKLSQFQNIPHEKIHGKEILENIEQIKFQNILYQHRNNNYRFDLEFSKGKNYLLLTNGYSTKKIIIEMCLGLAKPISGSILYNNIAIENFDYHHLRSQISLIDNSALIEGTLREYLTFNQEKISENYVMMVLDNVDLMKVVMENNEGLDLRILPSGWPFSESEKILLKVARALINKTQIIIADEVLDMLEPKIRSKILKYLTLEHQGMFIYFSHRYDDLKNFENKIFIEKDFSCIINDSEDLNQFLGDK